MSDEPPFEYEVWEGPRQTGSFFGCLGAALGLIFLFTGGSCVLMGLGSGSIFASLIGLVFLAAGWAIWRR